MFYNALGCTVAAPAPSTTSSVPAESNVMTHCGDLPTGSSASCTDA
jgi:hypothetical protein